MKQFVSWAIATISITITILTLGIFLHRYFLIFENERHFDIENMVVYQEYSVFVYGLIALISAMVSAWLLVKLLNGKK